MSEIRGARTCERENSCRRSSFYFWILLFPLVLILSLRKLRGFLLYGFPEENYLCLLSLVFITVHVILSDKILISYCLNYENLTLYVPCLASNFLIVYQMTHNRVPKQVNFIPNDVEINEIASGKLVATSLANHHAKPTSFPNFW